MATYLLDYIAKLAQTKFGIVFAEVPLELSYVLTVGHCIVRGETGLRYLQLC
jgi:hypothetical protein